MDEVMRPRKVALDPTSRQRRLLASHAGASRFAYNRMLAEVKSTLEARKWERKLLGGGLTPSQGWSRAALRKTFNANKNTWAPWWGEVSKEAFSHGCESLSIGLKAWADALTGKRDGQMGFPRFKSRRGRNSFAYTTGAFRLNHDGVSVQLPRIGRVHVHEPCHDLTVALATGRARLVRITVSESGGRWWASLSLAWTGLPERTHRRLAPAGTSVGVDVGMVDLLVAAADDGREVMRVPAPDTSPERRKLARLQRKAARQQRGSNRHARTQARIAQVHARMASVRTDTIHKATTALAHGCDGLVVEDLDVAAMGRRKVGARGRGFNRSLASAALAETIRQLKYKTADADTDLVVADRWFASSKTCSGCGVRKPNLRLSERTFDCDHCETSMDRDTNAAVNLARCMPGTSTGSDSGTKNTDVEPRMRPNRRHRSLAGASVTQQATKRQPGSRHRHETGTATGKPVAAR